MKSSRCCSGVPWTRKTALRSGREPDLLAPLAAVTEINLHVPALLPDDFVPDVHLRLILYKRISATTSAEELRELGVDDAAENVNPNGGNKS